VFVEIIEGTVRKFGDSINTDLIVPGEFLTEGDPRVLVENAFGGIRPGFASEVSPGDIIVAGRNFGSGSSREEAVFVVKKLGISAVVAESIARIYFRNLINNGIPALTVKGCSEYFEEGDRLKINLKRGIIINLDLGKELKFDPLPEFILEILNAGGIFNLIKAGRF